VLTLVLVGCTQLQRKVNLLVCVKSIAVAAGSRRGGQQEDDGTVSRRTRVSPQTSSRALSRVAPSGTGSAVAPVNGSADNALLTFILLFKRAAPGRWVRSLAAHPAGEGGIRRPLEPTTPIEAR
jgi:hypothetical protein